MNIKCTFLRADNTDNTEGLKGSEILEDIDPEILLDDLSDMISGVFAIPEGRNYAFYMENDVRKGHIYSDAPIEEAGQKYSGEATLASALISKKFKYEYSFTEGYIFQCEVM